jgi:hypothetical protein
MMDMVLSATSVAIHLLIRFRHWLQVLVPRPGIKTAGEETLLTMKWVKAKQKKSALQSELDRPTTSRLYAAQVKLWEATKAAGEKCHGLFLKIRAVRKLKRDSQR